MREYTSEKSGMKIQDNRDEFLSKPEMDQVRRENLASYIDINPEIRTRKKQEKNESRALELIPEAVFESNYQAEVLKIYNLITNILKTKLKTKQKYTDNKEWKNIYEANILNNQQVFNFFFQEPFFTEKPTVRSFVKKIPNQASFATDINERIFKLMGTGEIPLSNNQIFLADKDKLSEIIFFVDSRFLEDLVDMFKEDGKQIYDNKTGALIGYEHPLFSHKKLQNPQQGNMIPIRLLEFGKPDVITPQQIGILQRTYLEIDTFFESEGNYTVN